MPYDGRVAKKILILGAGFGGLETATGLAAALRGRDTEIALVDKRESFFVGFAKIDVLFGRRSEAEVRSPYTGLRAEGVRFVPAEVTAIDTDARRVETTAGAETYDTLVVALGAALDPDATPGFRESGGHEFYSMAGAVQLRPVVEAFASGKLVLGVLGLPYKCPPAPFEVACQLHERFVSRGVRDHIDMTMVIPGARPVPNPAGADLLEQLLRDRGIGLVAGSAISAIDVARKQVVAGAGEVPYDLFIGVPVHVPPPVVRASKLGKAFVPVNPATLETAVPGVYAIGDVAKIPVGADGMVPKAGAFAEDAARTVVAEILAKEGLAAPERFRAKGACYFEVGGGLVGKLDADYLGGDKPKMRVEGPTTELHAEKVAFETTRRARWFAG